MAAEALRKYPVFSIGGQKFVYIEDPVEVWTPVGRHAAPQLVGVYKMPVRQTLVNYIESARRGNPPQRLLTCGERNQIRKRLEQTNPEIGRDMIRGPFEATATLVVIPRPEEPERPYADGIVMEHPEIDESEKPITDEGIPRARVVWGKMAVPTKSGYVLQMPRELDPFFDILYGIKDARSGLPDYAYYATYVSRSDNPNGWINPFFGCLHGSPGGREHRGEISREETGRVTIRAMVSPFDSDVYCASRAAVDLDDSAIRKLLENAVPVEA